MAISGGWVGTSAVNETGQRWMSAAATSVQLGTPFWMSQLSGRAKWQFQFAVGNGNIRFIDGNSDQANVNTYGFTAANSNLSAGWYTVSSYGYSSYSNAAFSWRNGNFDGYEITSILQVNSGLSRGDSDRLYISVTNGPNAWFNLHFTNTGDVMNFRPVGWYGNQRVYYATPGRGWLQARNGWTLECSVTW